MKVELLIWDGKKHVTEKAEALATVESGNRKKWGWWKQILCQLSNGEFYLLGEWQELRKRVYSPPAPAVFVDSIPLTQEEALEWLNVHGFKRWPANTMQGGLQND